MQALSPNAARNLQSILSVLTPAITVEIIKYRDEN